MAAAGGWTVDAGDDSVVSHLEVISAGARRALDRIDAPPEQRDEPPPPAPPAGPSVGERRRRAVGASLVLLAVAVLGFLVFLYGFSDLQQHRTQSTLYKSFRGRLATATAPINEPLPVGKPVALLTIPRLHMRQVVVEGTTSSELESGPGHRRNTPLPGQAGVSVLLGRRATYGAPFSRITDLVPGDVIGIVTGEGASNYRVLGVRSDRSPAPTTAGFNRLSLVTANSSFTPSGSVIVDAVLTTQPYGGPSALPPIAADERSLAGDSSAAGPLVLWSQLLLLASAATVWLYTRWAPPAAYLVSTPILLAIGWQVCTWLSRILPNTL
jgi:LPXTG-site transpeptidase (sortase) family protein